jgi:hypothetical protein
MGRNGNRETRQAGQHRKMGTAKLCHITSSLDSPRRR